MLAGQLPGREIVDGEPGFSKFPVDDRYLRLIRRESGWIGNRNSKKLGVMMHIHGGNLNVGGWVSGVSPKPLGIWRWSVEPGPTTGKGARQTLARSGIEDLILDGWRF